MVRRQSRVVLLHLQRPRQFLHWTCSQTRDVFRRELVCMVSSTAGFLFFCICQQACHGALQARLSCLQCCSAMRFRSSPTHANVDGSICL